jgi:hypothetical protein
MPETCRNGQVFARSLSSAASFMFREDRLLVIAFRRSAAVAVLTSLTLASCGGGGGSSTPHVNPTPTPPPGQFNQADYTCPTSDTSSAVARSSASAASGARSGIDAVRRGLARPSKTSQASPNLIAVSYSRTIASQLRGGDCVARERCRRHPHAHARLPAHRRDDSRSCGGARKSDLDDGGAPHANGREERRPHGLPRMP